MINLFVLALLVVTVLASPLGDYEKKLKKEGFDLKVLREEINEQSKEVEDEFGSAKMKAEIARLRENYKKAGVHVANEEKESTVLDINGKIADDLYEGDLELTPEQWKTATDVDPLNPRTRRQALSNLVRMWTPMGQPVIPYNFSAGYPAARIPLVKTSLDFWQARTCLTFRPATAADKNVIQFHHETEKCSSSVGMKGGVQKLNLATGCQSMGTITHEVAHALGRLHVQARSDRDAYIRIDVANIKSGAAHNFVKEPATGYSHYDIPYELGSVQHYSEKSFALNEALPTIYAVEELYQYSMNAPLPTFYDTLLINRMYKCTDKCVNKIVCQNGGVQHGADCNKCFCPRGWAGTNCEKRPEDAQVISVANGTTVTVELTASTAGYVKDKLYILQAPKGKKIQATVTKLGEKYNSECKAFGMEIIPSKDTRPSGLRFCYAPTQAPVTSEGDSMLIWVYSRRTYGFNSNIAIKLV